MGNTGSSAGSNGRGNHGSWHPRPPPPHPEIAANRHVIGVAPTLNPSQYPNVGSPSFYQYPGYFPPPTPAMTMLAPRDLQHRLPQQMGPPVTRPPVAPYVEHQKAVTIRNDVNVKKETFRVEPDEENPGHYLVAFTFDATVAGCITIVFFAKEGEDCQLTPTKESLLAPVTVYFQAGLDQKFRQPPGTGIDLSMFEEAELLKEGNIHVHPLTVKAEAAPVDRSESINTNLGPGHTNSQITLAVFDREKSNRVRVVNQLLWVNGMKYELQEIYGIGNSVDTDFDGNESGKECVICLVEPRGTTVLPCRHMCLCSGCAKVLRFQTNRCPICRQPVERLLEIKVTNGADD